MWLIYESERFIFIWHFPTAIGECLFYYSLC
nr:MAG TPA: hypothetical protein [Caudoviricetes sp.]